MSELSIPYALHFPSGSNRSPDAEQDGRGMKANVCCLGCEERLVHRRASYNGRRRAHYAHTSNSKADVQYCRETAIHALVKDILAGMSGKTLILPKWKGISVEFTPIAGETEVRGVVEGRVPDVVLRNRIGQMLAVEVFVSNRKTRDAIRDFRRARLPVLEFPASLDDAHIDVDAVTHRLKSRQPRERPYSEEERENAKWLVYPVEPFDSDNPPLSPISAEYLRSKVFELRSKASDKMMLDSGFMPVGVEEDDDRDFTKNRVWTCSKDDMTCMIGNYVCGQYCSCSTKKCFEEPSYTFRVGTGDWNLICEIPFILPSDALQPSAKTFRAIQDCLQRESTPPSTQLETHYRKNEKGNWVSHTAVRGIWITVFHVWNTVWRFGVSSRRGQWVIWGKHRYDSPEDARTRAETLAATFRDLRIRKT